MSTSEILPEVSRTPPRAGVRYGQAVGLVAVWMLMGAAVRASGLDFLAATNVYLLIGIPLTLLFQRVVRREPLVKLWRVNDERFRMGIVGMILTILAAATPAMVMVVSLSDGGKFEAMKVVLPLWLLAAVGGAFGAGFCLRHTSFAELRKALPGFLAACLIGGILFALSALGQEKSPLPSGKLMFILNQFLLYFPVCFAIEEVTFRGLIDTHVHPRPSGRPAAWGSAIFVSALWGLWHLPVVPLGDATALLAAVPILCVFHALVGVPLSFCWRSSGSLLMPCAAHALIDSYRNAIMQ